MQELERALKEACQKLFQTEIEPEITRPDEKFGDYATNIAMQLAKKSAATPRQIAERLADELQDLPGIKEIGIAGPGFINFTLTDEALQKAAAAAADLPRPLQGQEILVEFGDPNPFKEMHIGHAYSYIVGDAISSLLEASGAKVERLSYHGDVGLHVAKAIWSMRQAEINRSDPTSLAIGSYYAQGSKAYEQNQSARREIDQVNQKIYDRTDSEINELYEW